MSLIARLHKAAFLALPLGLALGAAGCSMDDIEFNGGIFNAIGLSDSVKSKSGDPKLAERAPLVIPPTLEQLPEPGAPAPSNQAIAGITDPDEASKLSKEEQERRQAEYCKVNYEQAKQRGDEATADNAVGPLGPCRPSVLTAIKKWNSEE
jgi:hypothetical protein